MTSPAPFNYSDDEWRAVVASIPKANVDLDSKRKQIEFMVSDFIAMSHHQRERFADGSTAKGTIRARDNITAALAFAETTRNQPLQASLKQALNILTETTHVEAFEILAKAHKGRSDPALALLYDRLLHFWTAALNGKLTTARSGGVKTSPAIRFLVASLSPVHPIKPETAATIVERERIRRTRIARGRTVASKKT